MLKSRRLFLITLILLGLLLSTMVAIAGCGGDTTTTSATATKADNSIVIGDRALKVLSAAPAPDYAANVISADKLSAKLADPAEKDKLYLLDIRAKADFDKGHIQGASQVDFAQWAAPENLSKLTKDKKIIVICYTGNTAAQASTGMRMLGYDASALRSGMDGWAKTDNTDKTIADLQSASYPVVMTPAVDVADAPPATTFDKPSDADYKVLAETANSFTSSMPASGDYTANTITPAKLNEKLGAGEKDKLFLLDIRAKDDFNKGHIDGAINVPFKAVVVPDNLKLLPKDKKIVVICYTGNTAATATELLRFLDYDSVNLKFGMMGWAGTGAGSYMQEIQSANNPVVTS